MKISLEKSAAKPPDGVYWVIVPTHAIGVLKQMRSKMSRDGLEDLVSSIREVGQINPGIVVGLSPTEADKYLRLIDEMWGTEYKLADFEPVCLEEFANDFYLFLVAGHRRLESVKLIPLGTFYCQLRLETNFSKALVLQFQENLHEAVPHDDEARFLTFLWRQEKSMKKGLTLVKFARKLGKKPEAVRRAIRFTSLPVIVQKLILPSQEFKKGIGFGILCELARLQEARQTFGKPYSEQDLIHLAYVLVVQQKTAKAAATWVTAQIQELEGQGNMFELSIQEAVDSARRTVGSGLEHAVRVGGEHMRTIARMHNDGGVRKVVSGSAVNAVTNATKLTKELAPKIIEGIKGARNAPKARTALKNFGT